MQPRRAVTLVRAFDNAHGAVRLQERLEALLVDGGAEARGQYAPMTRKGSLLSARGEFFAAAQKGTASSLLIDGGHHAVAHARLRLQVARPLRIRLDLLAQAGHVHVKVVRLVAVLGAPNGVQKHAVR